MQMNTDLKRLYPVFISGLAIITAQILHGILFYISMAMFLKNSPGEADELLVLIPGLVAVLGGGFFQGRLLPESSMAVRLSTGFLNSFVPVVFHLLFSADPFSWVTDVKTLVSIAGGVLIWIAGTYLGQISCDRNPSPGFDRMLRNISTGAVAVLLVLYGFTWISLRFSVPYKMAQEIELPLPEDTLEIKDGFMSPEILSGKRFEWTGPAGDEYVYSFFKDFYEARGYQDVSSIFQELEPGVWEYRKEAAGTEEFEFQMAGAHWKDLSGKVLISMLLHGERVDASMDWETGSWKMMGMIFTRGFAQPDELGTNRENTPDPS